MTIVPIESDRDMELIEKRMEDFENIKKSIKKQRIAVVPFIEYFLLDGSNSGSNASLNTARKQFFVVIWDVVDGVDMSTQVMDTPITTIISKFISTVRKLHDMNVFHGGKKTFFIYNSFFFFFFEKNVFQSFLKY